MQVPLRIFQFIYSIAAFSVVLHYFLPRLLIFE